MMYNCWAVPNASQNKQNYHKGIKYLTNCLKTSPAIIAYDFDFCSTGTYMQNSQGSSIELLDSNNFYEPNVLPYAKPTVSI